MRVHKKRTSDIAQRFFMMPAVLLMGSLFVYPLAYLVYTSFTDRSLIRPQAQFIGFGNYVRAVNDSRFVTSIQVTVVYAVLLVTLTIFCGLLVAVVLNQRQMDRKPIVRGGGIIRAILLLPAIMAPVATAALFSVFLFQYDFGVANYYLRALGLPRVGWLIDASIALITVVSVEVWVRAPYSVLIFDAGIGQIPRSYYESAMLDGATRPRQVLSITLPLLKPQLMFAAIFQATFAFRQFAIVYMLTGGGPRDSTRLMSVFIYQEAFDRLRFGYSMAQSVILILLAVAFVVISLKVIGKAEVT